jgi:phosphoribosylformimino-5-aminoimidazole carboxamide ribotide isomerase
MLIPSIDLKGGKVVQLVQGDKVAIESSDVFRWVRRFQGFPMVQIIDLDSAMGSGDNNDLVRRVSAKLVCRVGGGIRSVDRAKEVVDAGAKKIVLSTALFKDGRPDLAFAAKISEAVGREQVVAALDTRGGRLVTHGWRKVLAIAPIEAMKALEPYCDEFLYTDIDHEGLMQGIDLAAVEVIRAATTRHLSAAGGITTQAEVDALAAKGIDAVVGMAIYTGALDPNTPGKP